MPLAMNRQVEKISAVRVKTKCSCARVERAGARLLHQDAAWRSEHRSFAVVLRIIDMIANPECHPRNNLRPDNHFLGFNGCS